MVCGFGISINCTWWLVGDTTTAASEVRKENNYQLFSIEYCTKSSNHKNQVNQWFRLWKAWTPPIQLLGKALYIPPLFRLSSGYVPPMFRVIDSMERDKKQKEKHRLRDVSLFHLYLESESNRHTSRYTILSRARLPVPPSRQIIHHPTDVGLQK